MFAVGDEKQSIFSFQDAAPAEFAQMRRHFERAHRAGGLDFVFREFKHSFRSGESVLGAVDEVFKAKAIAASVSADSGGFPPHIALPDAPPSLVEIWEPTKPEEREPIEGWDAPFDTVSETSPRVKLAQRIARTVRKYIAERMPVGIEGRAARYGDVLVLVRQRGPLFEAIIRALKNEGVEVAGADRLMLTEHIAVMDLMALADALLLREDDLALATALRSPLFGFTDDDLFAIAWNRGRSSLRNALAGKAAEQEKFNEAAARLDALAQAARRETPFGFYAQILGAGGGRHRFLARLGAEANDALDEFLNLALEYERRETPSLQGFVAWLRAARAEVKRDMEIAARRSPGHDRARRQGPGSADRDPRRYHDAARRPAAAAAPQACRRRDDLGGTQGRRRRAGRGGAPRGADRSRARVSPASLRRHDPRRRPADRVRRRRRTQAADRLLVRSRHRAAAAVPGRGRRRRGKSLALSQACRDHRASLTRGGFARSRARRASVMAAPAGAGRSAGSHAALAVLGIRRRHRRSLRRRADRLPSAAKRSSAAASSIG